MIAWLVSLTAAAAWCPPPQHEVTVIAEDFDRGLGRWRVEAQDPRTELALVRADGRPALDVQAPRGLTLWLQTPLSGDYAVRFVATPLPAPASAGALAGRVSDLNMFWNAAEAHGPGLALRQGAFAEYDTLRAYYVGFGANGNATTRLRRYDGSGRRVLLDGWADPPEQEAADRRGAMTAHTRLMAGRPVQVQLVSRQPTAADPVHLRWWADDQLLFEHREPAPWLQGHFGLRTTASRWQFASLRVLRCEGPADAASSTTPSR